MFKLIGTDFDGTYLDDNKNVPEENIRMLKKAKQKKIKIVGITGRTLESAKSVTDIDVFDYLILNNGSNIYDVENDELIYNNSISKDVAREITALTENEVHQFDYCTFLRYNLYKNFVDKHLPFIKEVKGVDDVKEPISKINIFLKENVDILLLKEKIEKSFSKIQVIIMQDSGNDKKWIVITPDNLNKKESLKTLGMKLNIPLEEMIFFGDGLNDLEVIEAVGCGVAMGNALEEVKKNAKAITSTNNEAGIADFLKQVLEKD